MENEAQSKNTARLPEKILAAIDVLICLIISVYIWQVFSPRQAMWPLPGVYLVEIFLLSASVAYVVFRDADPGGAVIWGTLGAVCAFTLLAAWTVGLLYLPVIVLLGVTGILFLRRRRQRVWIHLAIAAVAAIAQGALILAAIQIL